jgi:hypothetical protein
MSFGRDRFSRCVLRHAIHNATDAAKNGPSAPTSSVQSSGPCTAQVSAAAGTTCSAEPAPPYFVLGVLLTSAALTPAWGS